MPVNYVQQQDDDVRINPMDFGGSPQEVKNTENLYETNDASQLIRTYVEDDIPEELKQEKWYKEFWGYLSKNLKLSFLEEEDIDIFDSYFVVSKCRFIMSQPANKINHHDLMMIDQLRTYLRTTIKRAIGFAQSRFNERTMLGTGIHQIVRSNTENIGSTGSGGGMFGGMKKLFGGK